MALEEPILDNKQLTRDRGNGTYNLMILAYLMFHVVGAFVLGSQGRENVDPD